MCVLDTFHELAIVDDDSEERQAVGVTVEALRIFPDITADEQKHILMILSSNREKQSSKS